MEANQDLEPKMRSTTSYEDTIDRNGEKPLLIKVETG